MEPAGMEKWRVKNLYLTFSGNTLIWGIKPFQPLTEMEMETKQVGEDDNVSVLTPEVICKFEICDDPPKGKNMHVFEVDYTAYLLSGIHQLPKNLDDYVEEEACVRLYEFSHTPDNSPKLVPPSKLPATLSLPFPRPEDFPYFQDRHDGNVKVRSPIISKIKGEVYMLYGDFGIPSLTLDMSRSFQVLKRGSCEWRTLPTPPFYDKGSPEFRESNCLYKRGSMGVVANKLCVVMSGIDRTTYWYDAETEQWDKVNLSSYGMYDNITLSSLVKEEDDGHRYSVVIGARISPMFYEEQGPMVVVASLVDGEGNTLARQKIPEAIPLDAKMIDQFELMELAGEDEEGGYFSTTFCLVVMTAENLLGLSVVRVSLLPPSSPKEAEEEVTRAAKKQKLSLDEQYTTSSMDCSDTEEGEQDTTSNMDDSDREEDEQDATSSTDDSDSEYMKEEFGDPFLEVEVVEKRIFDMKKLPGYIFGSFTDVFFS